MKLAVACLVTAFVCIKRVWKWIVKHAPGNKGGDMLMELKEAFQVLGIEQTKDERTIKNAYREKLAVTNPEDNPEGFKRLRSAYEQACAYTKTEDEEPEQKEEDLSPSGIWAAKAKALYSDMSSRQDVKKWKALFEEDTFLSLEDEENCRKKLLIFMMEHYRLPDAVWKLLDEKLSIIRDAGMLREYFPADFIRYIVNKCKRGEDVDFSRFEGARDADYDLFLQYYDRCWQSIVENELQQAEEYIKNADELQIFHPVMEICRANLYLKQEKKKEAAELLDCMHKRFPEDDMLSFNTAEVLWKCERKEEAAEIYEELKGENDSHYMANVRLANWYYEKKRFQEAKKCAEAVLSVGGDDEFMELLIRINGELEKELEQKYNLRNTADAEAALELGWCYLQDGKTARGIMIAEGLEGRTPPEREAEREGLLTKLLMEQSDYEEAIEESRLWEKALLEKLKNDEDEKEAEKDQDRLRQAHLIRMQSYRCLGYKQKEKFSLAIEEAERIETGTEKDIGLLLEKAQIYMEMEEYEKSLELAKKLIEEYQVYAAYATAMEVSRRQWDASGVISYGRQCIRYFPSFVRSYEHMAKVYLDLNRKEDLYQLFEEAEQNGVKSVLLDAYRYGAENGTDLPEGFDFDKELENFRREYLEKANAGDEEAYEKGLPIVTKYLYFYPGTYMLVERGIFYRSARRYEEAREDFEKALAENPAQFYALRGLSFLYKYQCEYDKALSFIKRAVLYGDEDVVSVAYADMARLYAMLGDNENAIRAFEFYFALEDPGSKTYRTEFAQCLVRAGRVEEAEKLVRGKRWDSYTLFENFARIYEATCHREKSAENLQKWGEMLAKEFSLDRPLIKAGFANPKKLLKMKKCVERLKKIPDNVFLNFTMKKAWHELMYGGKQTAMIWFEIYCDAAGEGGAARNAWSETVFASILCDDEKRGRKYAAKLVNWLKEMERSGRQSYCHMQKLYLESEILAVYYTESNERLKELLDREEKMESCYFCNYGICKEIEAIRILYLLRLGKKEEARRRVECNLRWQPLNEYTAAIQHMKGL